MKRFFNIFFALLIVLSTVGVSVTKHYCGDMLESIAFTADKGQCCGEEGEPTGCCHSELDSYALEGEFQLVQYSVEFTNAAVAHVIFFQELDLESSIDREVEYFKNFDKYPPPPDRDIFIQVQSFLL